MPKFLMFIIILLMQLVMTKFLMFTSNAAGKSVKSSEDINS